MDRAQSTRTIVIVVLTSVLALSSGCTCSSAAGTRGEGKNGLELVASKTTYAAGEQVSITVNLTNLGTTQCRMLRVTEGAVTIRAMTCDGNPVSPTFTGGNYIDGFTSFLLGSLVAVAPGGSVSVPWEGRVSATSEHLPSLETSTLGPPDGADIAYWPVNQPGRYELTVSYVVPPMADRAPADLCRITDTASVNFVVEGGE